MEDADFAYALQLQEQFDAENAVNTDNNSSSDPSSTEPFNVDEFCESSTLSPSAQLDRIPTTRTFEDQRPASLIDPSWELIDPNPDARALFLEFNDKYFWGKLEGVEVRWSPRMTSCAGLCVYEGHGGLCSVRLSLPLLKLRPRKDLVETLLDHDGHGPNFHSHMNRLNKLTGTKISVYHTFYDEVASYQQHWWRCDGPCRNLRPYYGYVKRAMNRAPSSNDTWWADHLRNCGGTYTKIKEPEGYGQKKNGQKNKTEGRKSISSAPTLMDWIMTDKSEVSSPKSKPAASVGMGIPPMKKPVWIDIDEKAMTSDMESSGDIASQQGAACDMDDPFMSDSELISAIDSMCWKDNHGASRGIDAYDVNDGPSKKGKDEDKKIFPIAKLFPGSGQVLGGSAAQNPSICPRQQQNVLPAKGSTVIKIEPLDNSLENNASAKTANNISNSNNNSNATRSLNGINKFLSKAMATASKYTDNPSDLKDGNEDHDNDFQNVDMKPDTTLTTASNTDRKPLHAIHTGESLSRKRTASTANVTNPKIDIRRRLSDPHTPIGHSVLVPNFTSVSNPIWRIRKSNGDVVVKPDRKTPEPPPRVQLFKKPRISADDDIPLGYKEAGTLVDSGGIWKKDVLQKAKETWGASSVGIWKTDAPQKTTSTWKGSSTGIWNNSVSQRMPVKGENSTESVTSKKKAIHDAWGSGDDFRACFPAQWNDDVLDPSDENWYTNDDKTDRTSAAPRNTGGNSNGANSGNYRGNAGGNFKGVNDRINSGNTGGNSKGNIGGNNQGNTGGLTMARLDKSDDVFVSEEEMVQCPVCQLSIVKELVNVHLDDCLAN